MRMVVMMLSMLMTNYDGDHDADDYDGDDASQKHEGAERPTVMALSKESMKGDSWSSVAQIS